MLGGIEANQIPSELLHPVSNPVAKIHAVRAPKVAASAKSSCPHWTVHETTASHRIKPGFVA
jgi:hypothetical protein